MIMDLGPGELAASPVVELSPSLSFVARWDGDGMEQ